MIVGMCIEVGDECVTLTSCHWLGSEMLVVFNTLFTDGTLERTAERVLTDTPLTENSARVIADSICQPS